jgi:hypothetical protein
MYVVVPRLGCTLLVVFVVFLSSSSTLSIRIVPQTIYLYLYFPRNQDDATGNANKEYVVRKRLEMVVRRLLTD